MLIESTGIMNAFHNFVPWILALGPWIAGAVIFFCRNWILEGMKRRIGHSFDQKIEAVRTELRKNEEQFKSELRGNENEISILRSSVLAGSTSRQSLLDKRRFEAVEKVWTAVNDLAQLKMLSGLMAILNFKEVAKEASDPRIQEFLAMIGAGAPDIKNVKNIARDEQPFLPDLAWAYFNAYSTILFGSLLRYSVLKIGLDDASKLLKEDGTRRILKAALPEFSKFIDENEPETYHYLLDELQTRLLSELRKVLEGQEADQAAAQRAKAITEAIKRATEEKSTSAVAGLKT
jgi:hypothetical protein